MISKEELLTPALLRVMCVIWQLPEGTFKMTDIYDAIGQNVTKSTLNKQLAILTEHGYLSRSVSGGTTPGSQSWEYIVKTKKNEYMARSNALYLKNHYGDASDIALVQFTRDLQHLPK